MRVKTRDYHWEVTEAKPSKEYTILKLIGTEEENHGEVLEIIHPIDEVEYSPVPQIEWQFTVHGNWRRLHHVFLLTMIHGRDAILSLERARVNIEKYQLETVIKFLKNPRPRLLLADDVGLGKTIQAGMIMMELYARRKADRVLIIVPASLQEQWHDEMKYKFNMNFIIMDNEEFKLQITSMKRGMNPWAEKDRIITSIDYAKNYRIRSLLRDIRWDLIIVDEAHYLAETGTAESPNKSLRSKFGEFIETRTDALLLLTATPHNGYTHSYASLLKLVHPEFIYNNGKIDHSDLDTWVQRRIKSEIKNEDGTLRFQDRSVTNWRVKFTPPELRFYNLLDKYCSKNERDSQENTPSYTVHFAMTVLRKRNLSSIYSLIVSLQNRRSTLSYEFVDVSTNRGLVRDYREGIPLTEEQLLKVEEKFLVSTLAKTMDAMEDEIQEIDMLINEAKKLVRSDSKLKRLIELLTQILKKKDEKVIIFTEYLSTQEYLIQELDKLDEYTGIITSINGTMRQTVRSQAARDFNTPEYRILIATDAASEGLNLQKFCRSVIHYDLPWNPNRLEQRNGRIDRWGQKRKPIIFNMVHEDTIEGMLLERIAEKLETIRRELGSLTDVIGHDNLANLDELLSRRAGQVTNDNELQDRLVEVEEIIDNIIKSGQDELGILVKPVDDKIKASQKIALTRALEEGSRLIPKSDDIKNLVADRIRDLGGKFNQNNDDSYRMELPTSIRFDPSIISIESAVFDRVNAIMEQYEKSEFLSVDHELVKTILKSYRSEFMRKGSKDRLTYAQSWDDIHHILFTYWYKIYDGNKELISEKIIPVILDLDGREHGDFDSDFQQFLLPYNMKNYPREQLDAIFLDDWEELVQKSREVASERIISMIKNMKDEFNKLGQLLLDDLKKWEEREKRRVERMISDEARIDLDKPEQAIQTSLQDFILSQSDEEIYNQEEKYKEKLQVQLRRIFNLVEERRNRIKGRTGTQVSSEGILIGGILFVGGA